MFPAVSSAGVHACNWQGSCASVAYNGYDRHFVLAKEFLANDTGRLSKRRKFDIPFAYFSGSAPSSSREPSYYRIDTLLLRSTDVNGD